MPDDPSEDRAFTEALLDLYARAEAMLIMFPAARHQMALAALMRAIVFEGAPPLLLEPKEGSDDTE